MSHHDCPRHIIPRSPAHRGITDKSVKNEQSLNSRFAGLVDAFEFILCESEEALCGRAGMKRGQRCS
jgi:hypothetical protein